jgi:hypothetical protein
MLIKHKGDFVKGLLLLVSFLVVLVLMFCPLFNGKNALEASDDLFNSIAKGSANYIPGIKKQADAYKGKAFDVTVKLKSPEMTQKVTKLFTTAGAQVTPKENELEVKGDLGGVMLAALTDADAMFNNREAEISSKYGFPGKEVLFAWHRAFKEVDKSLKKQKLFKESKFLDTVIKKGVELGYNFANIVPETASSKAGILTFALVFYVIYTLWWGIGILMLFEGFGLQMKAGAKKEV